MNFSLKAFVCNCRKPQQNKVDLPSVTILNFMPMLNFPLRSRFFTCGGGGWGGGGGREGIKDFFSLGWGINYEFSHMGVHYGFCLTWGVHHGFCLTWGTLRILSHMGGTLRILSYMEVRYGF